MAETIRRMLAATGLVILLLTSGSTFAQSPSPPSDSIAEARRQEAIAAFRAAAEAAIMGPADIPLLSEAQLHLPANMAFIPPAQAGRLLKAWGNRVDVDPVGLVLPAHDTDDWIIVIRFIQEGYIKDDDARHWDAAQMLASLRVNSEQSNADRRARGFPEIEIIGWIAPPAYDAGLHRLVYSLAQKPKFAPDNPVTGVSYNTYALGRYGYFSVNLLTNSGRVARDKVAVASVLAGLDYNAGHRYADFEPSTDQVAAYGLATLVGVAAAKKLGFLAFVGAFLLKFSKIIIVGLAAVAYGVVKFLRRQPKSNV